MSRRVLWSVWFALASTAVAGAQELRVTSGPRGRVPFLMLEPVGFTTDRWVPVVVLFPNDIGEVAARDTVRAVGDELTKAGFVVACPVRATRETFEELRPLLTHLRRVLRIEQGGVHTASAERIGDAIWAVRANRSEIQTFTAYGADPGRDLVPLRQLPARRIHALADATPAALAAHLQKLHAERTLPGAAGEVARVLDEFHDAAANAKAGPYFTILPDDAVFLGTDGTERWTGEQFRKYAMPYFKGESAWTYVCLRRCVNMEPGDTIAWFDETFDNEAYGECRGSGVLAKRDGKWVLRQYHLTVPVPNDVTRDVAARIRAFQDGTTRATTVVVVRHAEKADESNDAVLSAAGRARAESLANALRDLPITAAFTSEFKRTAETVAPVCAARGVQATAVKAEDVAALAAAVRAHRGETVLVCGHSNTVPQLLKRLGIGDKVAIGDDEFDRLFVVTIEPEGAHCLALRYR